MFVNGNGCHVIALVGSMFLMLATVTAINVSLGVDVNINVAFDGQKAVCTCDMRTSIDWTSSETCESCSTKISNRTWLTNEHKTSAPTKNVSTPTRPKITDFRIPTDLYPYNYKVQLQPNMTDPDPKNFTFKGYVKIWLRCKNATDKLTLHTKVLTVDPGSIIFSGGPRVLSHSEDTDREFLILRLDANTTRGRKYSVQMEFTSPLKDDLKGLYYSKYMRNGKPVYLATTQFEPADARMAFPCFDEPAIKATFDITLVRPTNYTSLSNMPIKRSKKIKIDGVSYVKDVFLRTEKMSTYLLAFVISDFPHIENTTENGVLFRVWSRHDVINNTKYAFDVGFKILSYFEEFFNITFPLPKLDMVAVPDQAFAGMENWGLMIMKESEMLSPMRLHDDVAKLVIHEVAHQWFGDLVSPAWWDSIWLNEGFASFMEYIGIDYLNPEWNVFEKFIQDKYIKSFPVDSLVTSHPIYRSNVHPSEFMALFDAITYRKSAAVIRMMCKFLGFKTLKSGLRLYLTRHQYGAATQDDLWSALTQQARLENKNIDVKDVMDTWTLQMNFPLVTVTRDYSYNGALSVQQERYLLYPNATEIGRYVSPFNYTWNIPLTFASNNTRNFNESNIPIYWLWRNETSKLINASELLLTRNTWFICNIKMIGYFRVNYQISNWLALAKQLEEDHQVIPVINRIQIISDALSMAIRNIIQYDTVFNIMDYLENERHYLAIIEGVNGFSSLDHLLSLSPVYGKFQKFVIKSFNHTFQYLNQKRKTAKLSDNEGTPYRAMVFKASFYDIPECVDDFVAQYNSWMDDPSNDTVDRSYKNEIYCKAILRGGIKEWTFLLEMYKAGRVELENVIYPLACTNIPWLLNRYLQMAIDQDSPIPKSDADKIVVYTARTNVGRSLAWIFFRVNFNKLKDLYGTSNHWTRMIYYVTHSLNTELELNELKEFKLEQDGNFGSGEAAMLEAIEKVEFNVQWMNLHYNTIAAWLKANVN